MKYLVVVESPAKSETIQKYLGKDFEVVSSMGHVRDLSLSGVNGYGVDVENDFTPKYRVLPDKRTLVKNLKEKAKKAEMVYLATDPDREGEAISWHLYETMGLTDSTYYRIVFNEVTRHAVSDSFNYARKINLDLVNSQETRRILDRIIGFSLSKLMQRKIGSKSAGRVQSAALKMICDKEKEIENFVSEEYWKIWIEYTKEKKNQKAELTGYKGAKIEVKTESEASDITKALGPVYLVSDVQKTEKLKIPRIPLITSTLQQEASTRFNYQAKKTMMIAQKLYEGVNLGNERVGLITYMRTDSPRLSQEFISEAKTYIYDEFGAKYYKGYKLSEKKKQKIQDAHEAIRPTSLKNTPEKVKPYLDSSEFKIYEFIYLRSLAALMSNAKFTETKVMITNSGYEFGITGSEETFPGFLKVYGKFEPSDNPLPEYKIGDTIKNALVKAEQKFTNPPLRYSEARLIKAMEQEGIGRPSTYASTIQTLKIRHYVIMENNMFVPTEQGKKTINALEQYFLKIIDIPFTASLEERLDLIASREVDWIKLLRTFYDEYVKLLAIANEKMEKVYPILLDEMCPECGKPLVNRIGRFGEFTACSGYPSCRYIKKDKLTVDPIKTGVKCPYCKEGEIVERISKRGRSKGQKFYACSRFPKCKATFSTLEAAKEIKS